MDEQNTQPAEPIMEAAPVEDPISSGLGVSEETSPGRSAEPPATRIDAFPVAPLSGNIDSPVEIVSAPEVATEPQVAEIPTEIPVEISSTPEVRSGQITVIDPTLSSQVPEQTLGSPGLGVSEETSAIRIDAFLGAPLSENINSSVANLSIEASAPPVSSQKVNPSLLERARLALQLRKQKKILKIMELFTKHETITNDDVEKFLHVSDSTATRYLSQLVKMGKVVQKGKTTMVMYAKQ